MLSSLSMIDECDICKTLQKYKKLRNIPNIGRVVLLHKQFHFFSRPFLDKKERNVTSGQKFKETGIKYLKELTIGD